MNKFKARCNIWNNRDKNSKEGIELRKKFANKKDENPMYGKKRDDFRNVILQSNSKKVECPYCGIKANLGNAKRWHFDNCKNKKLYVS